LTWPRQIALIGEAMLLASLTPAPRDRPTVAGVGAVQRCELSYRGGGAPAFASAWA